jgi:hypothetical protein
MARMNRVTRRYSVLAAVAITGMLVPGVSRAQGAADVRWDAWVGCWASGALDMAAGSLSRPVCVVPAGGSAVEVIALNNGQVVSRERIDADGAQHASDRDGCAGWQSARWSQDGHRLFLRSEHQCAAEKRTSSGLIAMAPSGEWLDVVGLVRGQSNGVRVLRHRPITDPAGLPPDIAAALRQVPRPRIQERRTLVAAAIVVADIVEASRETSDSTVAAWLNDIRQPLFINRDRLVELADAGVPDRVIDMMIGLAYPKAFSVPPSPTMLGALASDEPGTAERRFSSLDVTPPLGCGFDYSLYGWGGCSSFMPFGLISPFGYLPYSYSPFSYGPYGYVGGFYAGGGWYSVAPTVVVRPNEGGNHGQVVNGRGYSSGSGGATASSGSGDSSSGGSGGSGGGSVGASSGGDRTAHPR